MSDTCVPVVSGHSSDFVFFYCVAPNPACVFVLCTRRSCVAVEFCWLAVKVACCSAAMCPVFSRERLGGPVGGRFDPANGDNP